MQSGSETHLKEWEAQRVLLLNDLQLSRQANGDLSPCSLSLPRRCAVTARQSQLGAGPAHSHAGAGRSPHPAVGFTRGVLSGGERTACGEKGAAAHGNRRPGRDVQPSPGALAVRRAPVAPHAHITASAAGKPSRARIAHSLSMLCFAGVVWPSVPHVREAVCSCAASRGGAAWSARCRCGTGAGVLQWHSRAHCRLPAGLGYAAVRAHRSNGRRSFLSHPKAHR